MYHLQSPLAQKFLLLSHTNSCGLWRIPLDELGDEAIELRDEFNFSAIKMRLGRETTNEDICTAQNVINAVPDTIVMSDFNQGHNIQLEAVNRLRALDDIGLHWFEEPLVYNDLAGCARYRKKCEHR